MIITSCLLLVHYLCLPLGFEVAVSVTISSLNRSFKATVFLCVYNVGRPLGFKCGTKSRLDRSVELQYKRSNNVIP